MTVDLTHTNGGREQDAPGPESALEALKAFKEAQERRVAHWKEYDEALEHYERSNLYADAADQTAAQEPLNEAEGSGSDARRAQAHRCGRRSGAPTTMAAATPAHYHSVALPMTDAIFSKIVSLVTSGLLDCSHSVRAVETELRTALDRADLADLVGQVQSLENSVLRAVVERDQSKRLAKLEGRDMTSAIAQLEQEIIHRRTDIQDVMADINAEMAEL